MFKPILVLSLSLLGVAFPAGAAHTHARHGMVLFGDREIYASHIVYKPPHNFQVILSLSLDEESARRYREARSAHPTELFTYLLDPLDLGEIATQAEISGLVSYADAAGGDHVVMPKLKLPRESYRVLYFDELPSSWWVPTGVK